MGNLESQLKKIAEKIEKSVSGEVTYAELFNIEFMTKYTDFSTIEELFKNCNLDIKTQEDYNSIPEGALDETVREKTKFSNWKEMIETAGKEEVRKRLNKHGIKTE